MKALAGPEFDATILSMRSAGRSFADIAKAVGCSHTTAWKRLEQLRHAGATVPVAERTAKKRCEAAPPAAPPLTPAQQAKLPAWRTCLGGCGKIFESSSAGNRICPRCQHRRDNVHPFTPDTL